MSQEKQIREYFNSKVNPTFEPLIYNLVKLKPQDLIEYCIQWFKNDRKNHQDSDDSDDQNYDDISYEQFENWRLRRLANTSRKIRTAICTEVYGTFHNRSVIALRKGQPKDQNIEMKILFLFMNSFLFSHFSEEEKRMLIDNMNEKKVNPGEKVIVQGEYGDQIYFIVQGEFECYQDTIKGKKTLMTYKAGQIFGELCILQNSARLTNISAKTSGHLYSLDRQVYRLIKKISIVKKRTLYSDVIRKINIFQNCDRDELEKIFDVLVEVNYEAGKTVIIEGETGNKFYIVLEGVLVAYKGNSDVVSQCFKEGDYFGEVALLNDTPRQATVKTITKCTLVYLTQDVFKRMVNREKVQKQVAQKYKQNKNIILMKRRGDQKI